jgi:hypothetical protein
MEGGLVAEAAPIVYYTNGWNLAQLRSYFEDRRGGRIEVIR